MQQAGHCGCAQCWVSLPSCGYRTPQSKKISSSQTWSHRNVSGARGRQRISSATSQAWQETRQTTLSGQAQPQNYESGLYHIDTPPFTELNTAHVPTENAHYIPITQKSLFCKRASIFMQLTTAALLKDPSGLRRLHHLLSDWKHFKHSAGTEVTCQSQTDQERSGFYYCIFNPSFLLSSSLYS